MHTLSNNTIVILGGAGLLGSALSRACATAGAHIIIVDINETSGAKLAKELGGTFIKANIADEKELTKLAKVLAQSHKTIDGLVHAAYPKTKRYGAPLEKADAKELLANLDLQLGGPLLSMRALMPLLSKNASVVFLSSIYGIAAPRFDIYKGTDMSVPAEYAGAKGGIIALTRYFAALLAPKHARVNAVSPGGIFANQPKSFVAAYSKKALLAPGMLTPEDITGAVVFLLSDASQKMTGQNLVIDGGWTL